MTEPVERAGGNRRPVMVTGASGMLGGNLTLDFVRRAPVVAMGWPRIASLPGVDMACVDLRDESAVAAVMRRTSPGTVIHCAALTDVDLCERDPVNAFAVNAQATRVLGREAAAVGAGIVFISTDSVFAGDRAPYDEGAAPGPVNVYAASKLEGEQAALATNPDALVLRVNIFGWSPSGSHGLAEWIVGRLRRGAEVTGYGDVLFAPITVWEVGRVIVAALGSGLRGIYHVACDEGSSKLDFAKAVAREFDLSEELVTESSVDRVTMAARRPKDTRLSPLRLSRALGREPPSMLDGVRELRRLELEGRRDSLRMLVG